MSLGRAWSATNLADGYHLSDVNDFTPAAKNLTNTGSCTFPLGKFENAVHITTTSTYLNYATSLADLNNPLTISFWLRLNGSLATSGFYGFFHFGNNVGTIKYLQAFYNNNAGTYRIRFDVSKVGTYFNYTLTVGKWYHFAFTIASSVCKVYINSRLVSTDSTPGSATSGTADTQLGHALTYTTVGDFDEFLIANTAWSEGYIRRYYASALGKL